MYVYRNIFYYIDKTKIYRYFKTYYLSIITNRLIMLVFLLNITQSLYINEILLDDKNLLKA